MRYFSVALSCILLAGCGGALPPPDFTETVQAVPYELELTFASEVAAPYYVNRGPFGSYRSYPVNNWLREELNELAERKSKGGETVTVAVRAVSLETDYDGIGQVIPLPTVFGRNEPPDLPERAVKSADMRIEVEIRKGRVQLLQDSLAEKFVQELEYDNISSYGRYRDAIIDYRPVLEGVVLETVRAVDSVIDRAVNSPD